jgi:uncharacterized protein
MEFEFDPAKSASNRIKHGIDFLDAQAIWDDRDATTGPGGDAGEVRLLRTGLSGGRIWTACFTLRDGRVRLISVRRARMDEETEYEARRTDRAESR